MDSVLGIIKPTDIFDIRWGHIRIEMQISKVKVGTSFENSDDVTSVYILNAFGNGERHDNIKYSRKRRQTDSAWYMWKSFKFWCKFCEVISLSFGDIEVWSKFCKFKMASKPRDLRNRHVSFFASLGNAHLLKQIPAS